MSMVAFGITHCREHYNPLPCPECEKEREQRMKKLEKEAQLEEFRKLIKEEIGNYFNSQGLPVEQWTICCNCGQNISFKNKDKQLLKAPTENLYFIKCSKCDSFTIVDR